MRSEPNKNVVMLGRLPGVQCKAGAPTEKRPARFAAADDGAGQRRTQKFAQ